MLICAGRGVCVCVCVCMCLDMISTDNILHFINTFIIIIIMFISYKL